MTRTSLAVFCALLMAALPAAAYNGREGWFKSHRADGPVASKPVAAIKPEPIPAKAQFGFVLTPSTATAPSPVGSYARGCLAGATQLAPTGPAWQIMRPSRNRNWGHPELVTYITRFATDMRSRERWPGLLIGDMSQPRGGPMLSGHASHQTGLDVDIWFKPMPATEYSPSERETVAPEFLAENDGATVIADRWGEGWVRLLRRAASYPEVARIFVHPTIKKALCEAPQSDRRWMTKVRAYYLHNDHFHVRLRCPPGLKSCIAQADPSPDDGCGKELDYWMKRVAKRVAPAVANAGPADVPPLPKEPPPKPAVVAAAPKAPPPAPHYVTLADLPAECTAVLADGKPPLLAQVAPGPDDVAMPEPSPARTALASKP